jgi:hypothetical protein
MGWLRLTLVASAVFREDYETTHPCTLRESLNHGQAISGRHAENCEWQRRHPSGFPSLSLVYLKRFLPALPLFIDDSDCGTAEVYTISGQEYTDTALGHHRTEKGDDPQGFREFYLCPAVQARIIGQCMVSKQHRSLILVFKGACHRIYLSRVL